MTVHGPTHVCWGWGDFSTEGPRLTSRTQAPHLLLQVHLLENCFLTHHCLLTNRGLPTVQCASWTHFLKSSLGAWTGEILQPRGLWGAKEARGYKLGVVFLTLRSLGFLCDYSPPPRRLCR